MISAPNLSQVIILNPRWLIVPINLIWDNHIPQLVSQFAFGAAGEGVLHIGQAFNMIALTKLCHSPPTANWFRVKSNMVSKPKRL